MSAVMFQAKIADLDGDRATIAYRLRKIADKIENGADTDFVGSEVKDRDGYLVGTWLFKQVGV